MESSNKLSKRLRRAKQAISFNRKSSNNSSSTSTKIIPDHAKQKITCSSTAKVGFVIPDIISTGRDSCWKFDSQVYGVVDHDHGDESVDMKAATYISGVRERFRLSV